MNKKKLTTGPLGFPVTSEQARQLESDLKHAEKEGLTYTKAVSHSTPDLVEGERADISTITNESIDLDKEVVLAKGLDFTSYQKNPSVYWDHDYDQAPVGRCAWVKTASDAIKAKTIYPSRLPDQQGDFFPDTVWALVSQRVVNGKSIGFVGLEARTPTQQEIDFRPELAKAKKIITKGRVFEYSVVYRPCNTDCLVELTSVAKSLGCEESRLVDLLKLVPKCMEFEESPTSSIIIPKNYRKVSNEIEEQIMELTKRLRSRRSLTAEDVLKKLLGQL